MGLKERRGSARDEVRGRSDSRAASHRILGRGLSPIVLRYYRGIVLRDRRISLGSRNWARTSQESRGP